MLVKVARRHWIRRHWQRFAKCFATSCTGSLWFQERRKDWQGSSPHWRAC